MKKFLETLALILGIMVVISPVILWAANQHFVTHQSLGQSFSRFQLYLINESIWDLETKVKLGEASRSDELKLKRQIDQRTELLSSTQ